MSSSNWKDRAIVEKSSWRSRAVELPQRLTEAEELEMLELENEEATLSMKAARASHPRTARELPPGYSEAAPSRELPAGYSFADDIDAFLDTKPDAIDAFLDAKDATGAQSRAAGDYGEALLTNLPTRGIMQGIVRGLPAAGGGLVGATAAATASLPFAPLAGPFAPAVPIIAGLGGAFLGGAAGGASRQAIAQGTAAAFPEAQYPILRPGQVLRDVAIEGATQAGGEGFGMGLGVAAKYAASNLAKPAVKVGSQIIRAATGTPERSAAAVLRDPGILSRALPVDEAGAAYAASTGGLKSGVEASREVFGKSHFSGEAIADKFDELLPAIQNGTMDTQTALALRQRTMKAINDLPFNQKELGRLLSQNIDQLDAFLEPKLPNWGAGKAGYRESMVAEDFNSWLPLNKNLSPNVLRTTAAIAAAAKSASEGKLLGLAAFPFVSPKVWGLGIQGASKAAGVAGAGGGVIYKVGARAATGGAGSALEQAYMRQRPSITPAY